MQRDFVSGMSRQVGWFVMIGIGTIILLLLVISVRTDVFAKKFHLYTSPPSATSFYEGQPVRFQGFVIGRVYRMELLDEGKVRIDMQLLDRYRHMVHYGAKVRLIKEGWIGEQALEISAGDAERSVVNDGDTIAYETEASIEQLLLDIKPAVSNANTLLRELAELSTWMNKPDGDLRLAFARLNALSSEVKGADIQQALERFSRVMLHLQSTAEQIDKHHVVERLSDSLKLTTNILDDLQPLAKGLGAEGPETFTRINMLLGHVDQLTRSLDIVAADLSELTPELPGLARESRSVIEEMRGLLKGLRGSWLFGDNADIETDENETVAPPALDLRP
ncbi:MAG: MlaD family protein [Mariprofundaceae bacterium]